MSRDDQYLLDNRPVSRARALYSQSFLAALPSRSSGGMLPTLPPMAGITPRDPNGFVQGRPSSGAQTARGDPPTRRMPAGVIGPLPVTRREEEQAQARPGGA
eukprot:CAMPEP_0115714848 /NCGR_PEP_ID=MMETSP0272-20121206/75461_1 /TAXON_ID=71861 /ORGANISM="Scrippsiella trochoidea, Strain CCMP3099" /LENGTH=101 /DNA_ID=CAMNT_0003157027 /DNA_START=199 /DNA_END=501 /DNA_ORIENTATION=-